jgi:spermidine synthase
MRALVYTCFLVSGATGLVYEVLWGKYLGLFIGSSAYAHAVVLATFMGGLAIGNAVLGRRADRVQRRLVLYGCLELGIGVFCLAFPLVDRLLATVYTGLASPDPGAAGNLALKVVLSVLALLPPTVMMGGTLPALSRYVVRTLAEAGRGLGLLYFINSAGAATGCLLAGFWLVPAMGLDNATVATAAVNILIGAAILVAGRAPESASAATTPVPEATDTRYSVAQVRWVYALICASGAVSMLYELVWIRMLSLVLGSSTYSFSVMLFTFIGGITIGGLVAGVYMRRPRGELALFAVCELGIFGALLLLLPAYERLPWLFNIAATRMPRTEGAFALYQTFTVGVCFAVMLVPTVLIGMSLPLAARVAARSVAALGRTTGSTFSMNTLGNVVGSLAGGFLIIPLAGLQTSMQSGLLASGLIGAAALAVARPARRLPRRLLAAGVVVVVAAATWALVPRWSIAVLNSGVFRMRERVGATYTDFRSQLDRQVLLFHRDGPDASVAVGHSPEGPEYLWLNVNGKTDASTYSDMGSQLLVAHIPLLLSPRRDRVLLVGLGSGISAGAITQHPIEHCDVVEISRAVVEGSHFFDRMSGSPLSDARVHLTLADAKEFLRLQPPGSFDVIISEPSNPWLAGIGNLFSQEFFADAARHLRPGGLFTQWLHLYEMNDSVLAVALNTLSRVFPYVTVWHPQASDLVMVASLEPQSVAFEELDRRLRLPGVQQQLTHRFVLQKVTSVATFLSLQVLSNRRFKQLYPGTGVLNTDLRPYLEYRAPQAFFAGSRAGLMEFDERQRCAEENPLYLAAWLRDRELSDAERRAIITQLSHGSSRSEKRLLGGLVYDYTTRHRLDSASMPETDRRLIRAIYAKQGIATIADRISTWRERIASETMTTRDWRDCRAFEAEVLRATSSIYVTPDVSRFELAHAQCVALLPLETPHFEQQRRELYRDLGVTRVPPQGLGDQSGPAAQGTAARETAAR